MPRPRKTVDLRRLSNDELLGAIHGCFVAITIEPEMAEQFAARGSRALAELRSRI